MLSAPLAVRSRFSGWGCMMGLALLGAAPSASSQTLGLQVASMMVDGNPAPSVANVLVRPPGAARGQAQTLSAGQALAPGAELTLPRGAMVVLVSSHDNKITLHPGARFVVGAVTAQGETHQPLGGRFDFQVKRALDYFNISYDRFTAAVKGTAYSIEIDPASAISFSVTEGVVEVERPVQIRIAGAVDGAEKAEASPDQGLRIAEDLKAGQSKRYQLNVAEYLSEFKNFADAQAYFMQALSEAQASGDQRRIYRALFNLMEASQTMGRPRAVLELQGRCLQVAQQLAWPPYEAGCLGFAGGAHSDLAEFRKAIALHEQALAINQRRAAGRDSFAIAQNFAYLGEAHVALGEARKGLDYYEQALAIRQRLRPGVDDRRVALTLGAMGWAHRLLGDQPKAIEHQEKSLAMHQRLYPGSDRPSIALNLQRLGLDHQALKLYRQSIGYLEKSLAMNERLYRGTDHPNIASNFNTLGVAYSGLGLSLKALWYYEKSLAMRERLYPGSDHPSVALSLNNLGVAYTAQRDYPKAVENLQKALAINERVFAGRDHPDIARTLANLASAYRQAGNAAEAARYGERASATQSRLKGQ